jgi:hypothetical protein
VCKVFEATEVFGRHARARVLVAVEIDVLLCVGHKATQALQLVRSGHGQRQSRSQQEPRISARDVRRIDRELSGGEGAHGGYDITAAGS